jgi:hypothetical protein
MNPRSQTEIDRLLNRIAATRTPEYRNAMRRHSAGVMQPTNRAQRRARRQTARREERETRLRCEE